MDSTPEPKSTKDVLVAQADEQLSHVHEQLARADEQLARVTEQLEKLEREGTGEPSPEPASQPSRAEPARRSHIGTSLLSAACIFGTIVAFLVWQSSRGGAKLGVTRWTPQLVSTSSLPPENPPLPARPDPPSVQVAAAEEVTTQAAPLAQPPPQDAAPTVTAAAPTTAGTNPELTQSLQTMTRDLTKLEQSVAELKAKQDRMASDYAKAIEQLKARQEDMTRRLASVSAQNATPRASPPRSNPPRRARERPLTPPAYWDYYYDEPW